MEIIDKRDDSFDADTAIQGFSDKTEIQNFYTDMTILITGGTGFLGILLIEKLLRSCSDLKKIILVIREKKGKSIQTRVKEMFEDEIFAKMREQTPKYWNKIKIISGCCEEPKMGISEDQIRQIQSEVDIVFHSAATVRFDEHIRKAYLINVGGTKNMLEIAKGMKNLKAFIYVSTAYSQSHLPLIEEKYYPGSFTDEEFSNLLEKLDDKALHCLTPIILNGRFNTYVLTKGIAEEVVFKCKNDVPVAIFRPSIVTPTVDDPLKCWTNNVYAATGVMVGSGVGFLRTIHCDPNCRAEIIPADRVTSALVVIPLHIQKKMYTRTKVEPEMAYPVYNFVTNQSTASTWGTLTKKSLDTADERELATDSTIWMYHLSLEKDYTLWMIKYFLYHLLPAPFFMLMEKLLKREAMIWKGYVKVFRHSQLFSFFMFRSWRFADANAKDLYNSLSPEDKLIFNCKTDVDWNPYFFHMFKGLATYITKFNWNNEDKLRTRRKIMLFLDRVVTWSFQVILFLIIFKFILNICSCFITK